MEQLKRFWKRTSDWGLRDDMPFELSKRIRLTNHFGIAIFLMASLFSTLYIIREIFIPMPLIVLASVGLSIIIFNKLHLNILARFLVSAAPAIALLMLNVFSKMSNPERIESFHYTNVRLLIAVTVLLPLTVFTLKEKKWMVGAAAIPMGIALFLDPIFDAFGVGSETLGIVSIYKKTAIDDLIVMMSVLLLTFIFLMRLNKQLQQRNKNLLEEAEATNRQLQEQQAAMEQNLKEIEAARQEDSYRSQIAAGLSGFSDLVRAEANLEKAYRPLLNMLVKYVKANQGGLYVTQGEGSGASLKLVACYAYGRQKYLRQTIEQGDGLIGQCFLEKESTLVEDVPPNYVNITSGLGEATPTTIFIMPLLAKDQVEGVIEIASFDKISEYDIEFLTKAGEHLAAAIAANRIHQKTQQLLSASERMSNELKGKENEMRQNVEELQATQEAMARKEREYLEKIAGLEAQLESGQESKKGQR